MIRFVAISLCLAPLFLLACGASSAWGQADRLENSPRHHEWVEVDAAGGRKVRTWVVYPEVRGPATAVVVIHENRGLNDWARGMADQLAEAGYVALAPDLLSGAGPDGGGTDAFESSDAASQGIYRLPAEQVLTDLDAVVAYARSLPAANKVVAVGGFCWGGGKAFEYACHNPDIAAACVFYGIAPSDEAAYEGIHAPVYGFYAGNDFRITNQVPQVETRMKQLGKTYEPVVYEGAGHAFMRRGETETDPQDPNRKAHDEAWQRWKTILAGLDPQ